jgi:hypothetical protein
MYSLLFNYLAPESCCIRFSTRWRWLSELGEGVVIFRYLR